MIRRVRFIDWPFAAPKNLAVITTRSIVVEGKPILIVSRDEDDDGWQFLDGSTPDEANAMVVSLYSMVQLDPSILPLFDLLPGWQAWREDANAVWQLGRQP